MLARPVGLPRPQRVLDLHRAQRARLAREEIDDPLTGATATQARARKYGMCVLRPGGGIFCLLHRAKLSPHHNRMRMSPSSFITRLNLTIVL